MIEAIGSILLVVVILVGVGVLYAIPTFFLWNWLMPDLFSLPQITFFQAVGINLLCAFLFKNTSSSSKD